MKRAETGWGPIHAATVAAMLLIALTAAEAEASHINPLVAPTAPWSPHLREMDEALAQRNVGAAEKAWHEAYRAALGGPGWEGMVAVGDAARRIAAVEGLGSAGKARVLRTYLLALLRAHQQASLDGVLRAGEAFASLGDREVADLCIRIAESLAIGMRDATARNRVRAFKERTAALLFAAEPPRVSRAQATSPGP